MEILQKLYDSEINFSVSCFWDGGIDVKIGDPLNGVKATACFRTISEAIEWLNYKAVELYPQSEFAKA